MGTTVTEDDQLEHDRAGDAQPGGSVRVVADPSAATAPDVVLVDVPERRSVRASGRDGATSGRPGGALAMAGVALVILAALLLGFVAFLLGGSRISASRTQDLLYDQLRDALGEGTAPISAPIEAGTAIGILSIPALGIEQVVVQGSTSEQTLIGPGHRSDTVLPGQAGSSVLLGRRVTAGAPFRDLDQLRPGDTLVAVTGQGEFRYVVDVVRTTDAPVAAIRVVPARLTLVTSDPAFAPTQQLVVSAVLAGAPAPATDAVTAATADEVAGAGDSSAALALALWSQLLLVIAVGITVAWTRYPRAVVWVAAGPVALAVVWNVYENAAALLSNTL